MGRGRERQTPLALVKAGSPRELPRFPACGHCPRSPIRVLSKGVLRLPQNPDLSKQLWEPRTESHDCSPRFHPGPLPLFPAPGDLSGSATLTFTADPSPPPKAPDQFLVSEEVPAARRWRRG